MTIDKVEKLLESFPPELKKKYLVFLTDKDTIETTSDMSVKEITIMLYALCKQNEVMRDIVEAIHIQLLTDKDNALKCYHAPIKE